MAIGTLHEAFGNRVVIGQRKLGHDVRVALAAKLWLALFQEATVQPAHFFG